MIESDGDPTGARLATVATSVVGRLDVGVFSLIVGSGWPHDSGWDDQSGPSSFPQGGL